MDQAIVGSTPRGGPGTSNRSDDPGLIAQKAVIFRAQGDLENSRAWLSRRQLKLSDPEEMELEDTQWLMERRPESAVHAWQTVLENPTADRGIVEWHRYFLGRAQQFAGDAAGARTTWLQARNEMEAQVKEDPANAECVVQLARIYAGLGDKAAALREGEHALRLLPAGEPLHRVDLETIFAHLAAEVGEKDRALDAIECLVTLPMGPTLAELRLYPAWDPLRDHPRFQKLLAGPEPEVVLTETASVPEKSIAVLPFENLSDDKQNAYFASGVQDEILSNLARIADLKVISRTSVMQYKSGDARNLREIGNTLGVAHILEGNVQRVANRVRVNAQLIDAPTDVHLWAATYDRDLTDVFAVETDIAKKIAESLQAKLTGSEQQALAVRPTENGEAHQLYLKGRYFWNKRTGEDLKRAIDYFHRAIEKDSNYALAYTGLADAYVLLPQYMAGIPKDCIPRAKSAAKKALELDETLGEAHACLAEFYVTYDLNFTDSIKEFHRAIELNPNYATAHQWYGYINLVVLGRFDEAIAEVKRALELDPLSLIINADLGATYVNARRPDEAIDQLRRTLQLDPNFYYAHWNLGTALELKGSLEAAIAEYQKARELNDDPYILGLLGHAYGISGRRDEALQILDQLTEQSRKRYVGAYNFAIVPRTWSQRTNPQLVGTELSRSEERIASTLCSLRNSPPSLTGRPRIEAFILVPRPPPGSSRSGPRTDRPPPKVPTRLGTSRATTSSRHRLTALPSMATRRRRNGARSSPSC